MNGILALMTHHGYALVFGIVLAEALGFPLPAALALVGAGAAAAAGTMNAPLLFSGSLAALLTGDFVLYVLGGYMGWNLLGALCWLSINPETCILRSAESFYKRGKATLLISKFIPGVNTMAAPLAGSMKMPPLQFLRFDLAGASLYAASYLALGYVFRGFLKMIISGIATASRVVEIGALILFVAYVAYRLVMYSRQRIYSVVPRIQVQELAKKLASEEKDNILLVDVRSHGYYDSDASRIQGSLRIEPNNLSAELKHLPKDKLIYLYCT